MLLRTRIIVFVMLVVTGVAGLVFAVGALRSREITARVNELEVREAEQAWAFAVTGVEDAISVQLVKTAAQPALSAALERGDEAGVTAAVADLLDDGFLRINVFGAGGEMLFSGTDNLEPQALIGAGRVAEAVREGRGEGGARVLDDGRLGVVGTAVIRAGDGPATGLIAAMLPLQGALDTMSRLTQAKIYARDRSGVLVYGADDALWKAAVPAAAGVAEHRGLVLFSDGNGQHHYQRAVLPVADLMGGRLATLYVIRDVSQAVEARRLGDKVAAVGVLLAFAVAVFALYFYLRHHFASLEDAVSALHRLAQGGRGGYVELPGGQDEIGRIAGAVEVFGQAVREVERAGQQRERRQRRQQRFIRRQMEQLASTLEEEARRDLLAELAQMEEAASDPNSSQSKAMGDELGLIALGFSRLATKVSVQQVQLSQLVRDLREALEDKRKLISLQQELEIAANMQLSILPREFPELAMMDIAASMVPAKEVGGDFYDVFELGENRLGVAVADVSGKGIPAAFFMLISRTMLRTVAAEGLGPAETLSRLNNLLSAENEQMMFVTLFYAEIDLTNGVVTYCSGGHNPPFVARTDGTVMMVERTAGTALATFPDLPYSQKVLTLAPGDTLFMYTDGVSEAFDPHEEMFGEDRLQATLAEAPPQSAEEALQRVMTAVSTFTTGAEQSDDITGIVVHWRG